MEFSVVVIGGDDSGQRESSTRLQRRDTPHHLKNKRVNAGTSSPGSAPPHYHQQHQGDADAQPAAEDRVRCILARQIGKLRESFESGGSSDPNDTAEVRLYDSPLRYIYSVRPTSHRRLATGNVQCVCSATYQIF